MVHPSTVTSSIVSCLDRSDFSPTIKVRRPWNVHTGPSVLGCVKCVSKNGLTNRNHERSDTAGLHRQRASWRYAALPIQRVDGGSDMHGFVRLHYFLLAIVRDLLVILPSFHHRTVVNAKYNHFIHLQESSVGSNTAYQEAWVGGREMEGEGGRWRERGRERGGLRERARESERREEKKEYIYNAHRLLQLLRLTPAALRSSTFSRYPGICTEDHVGVNAPGRLIRMTYAIMCGCGCGGGRGKMKPFFFSSSTCAAILFLYCLRHCERQPSLATHHTNNRAALCVAGGYFGSP